MHKRWMVLAIVMVWCLSAQRALGQPTAMSPQRAVSLDDLAKAYPTPKALARFLHTAFSVATDQDLFGEVDRWQAPDEFFIRRVGDCEDYALLAQAILQRQGRQAVVFNLYGPDGYAHTVCVFLSNGRYHVINQDRVRWYRAKTLEEVAQRLNPRWTYGAVAHLLGARGAALQTVFNLPHLVPGLSAGHSLLQ